MAERETPLERFDAPDPNLKMALEETPWLRESRGGDKGGREFLRVLDPAVARAQRDSPWPSSSRRSSPTAASPGSPAGRPRPT
jgi:hypothetical protein